MKHRSENRKTERIEQRNSTSVHRSSLMPPDGRQKHQNDQNRNLVKPSSTTSSDGERVRRKQQTNRVDSPAVHHALVTEATRKTNDKVNKINEQWNRMYTEQKRRPKTDAQITKIRKEIDSIRRSIIPAASSASAAASARSSITTHHGAPC
jgi:Mg2+ and Co2+ transporter CorA